MKKQDIFSNMFAAAINWDAVEENADAIAAILNKDDDGKGTENNDV